ncbi:MAG TPA: ketopantoate reductase C-terminal domain-containing protein [Candidatus Polarisedimenticolia bacterium]|nr:ketopantoate reductase C-terminal domain-containing protein [Candidatus Polarisedimenticolia bacterium]
MPSSARAVGGLALVGAGSLGQAFAGLLARSGQPVTLLATPETLYRLRDAGTIRLRGVVTLDVPVVRAPGPEGAVGVTDDPADLPRGAGILFATKGHHLRAAAARVRAAWPAADDRDAWVGGLQNGMAKDDVLAEIFGAAMVVGAVTILGGERRPEGEIAIASLGCTYLGEIGAGPAEPSPRVAEAIARLHAAAIPAEAPPDIRTVLWSKACNAAGVFGVTSVLRISTPRLFRDPHLIRAYLGLVRETAAIAAAHGVPVGDYTNFPIRTYVTRPDEETVAALSQKAFLAPAATGGVESFASMTQDLRAGRAIEVDDVFADLVERGDRAGVAVPRLRLVRDFLRGLDPGHQPG